jgi:hypothetical protein
VIGPKTKKLQHKQLTKGCNYLLLSNSNVTKTTMAQLISIEKTMKGSRSKMEEDFSWENAMIDSLLESLLKSLETITQNKK